MCHARLAARGLALSTTTEDAIRQSRDYRAKTHAAAVRSVTRAARGALDSGPAPSGPRGGSTLASASAWKLLVVHAEAETSFANALMEHMRAYARQVTGGPPGTSVDRARTPQEVGQLTTVVVCVLSEAFAADESAQQLLQVAIMRHRTEGGVLICVADAAEPLAPHMAPSYMRLLPCLHVDNGQRRQFAGLSPPAAPRRDAAEAIMRALLLRATSPLETAPTGMQPKSPPPGFRHPGFDQWRRDTTVLVCTGLGDGRLDALAPRKKLAGFFSW